MHSVSYSAAEVHRDPSAPRCGYCGRRLSDSGGSLDFCDVTCQEQWHAARADQLPEGHNRLVRPAMHMGWF
jgi:tRNA(Ile2) C34 agmatinyltransferase TiaS